MKEQTLDLRGQVCPDPLFQVQAAMEGLAGGDRLIALVDYPLPWTTSPAGRSAPDTP